MTASRQGYHEICAWSVAYLTEALERDRIDIDERFSRLGMDSVSVATYIVALEEWLGRELDPEIAAEFPTVAALARHLSGPAQ